MKVTALYHMGDGQNDMPVTYVPSLRAQHAHLRHFERNTTPSVIPNPEHTPIVISSAAERSREISTARTNLQAGEEIPPLRSE